MNCEYLPTAVVDCCSPGTTFDGLFETDLPHGLEEQDGPSQKKPVNYTKTLSMCAGVDRIDEYSEMEIKP